MTSGKEGKGREEDAKAKRADKVTKGEKRCEKKFALPLARPSVPPPVSLPLLFLPQLSYDDDEKNLIIPEVKSIVKWNHKVVTHLSLIHI